MNMATINLEFNLPSGLAGETSMGLGPAVTVTCHTSLEELGTVWTNFQQHAHTTAYNSYQWAAAWQATVGAQLQVKSRILVGRGINGELLFILPLQIRRRWRLDVLEWHGSPDISYGFGLFSKCFAGAARHWFEEHLAAVLGAVGEFDALCLLDMPESMLGLEHPLRRHFNLTATNETFMLRLNREYDTVYERKRNAETRRANRRKDARLQEMGELTFRNVAEPSELKSVIDVMLKDKVSRLAANGIHGVFEATEHRMVHMLAAARQPDGTPMFSTHALQLDGKLLAVTFGGVMNSCYWFYISSLAPKGPETKHSPGDYALRRTIEACCEGGLGTFDFGPGSAVYKTGWTDETTKLHCLVQARSLRALPFAMAIAVELWAKRRVKKIPLLKQLAFSVRRIFRSTKPDS